MGTSVSPTVAPGQLEIGDAFGYVFRSRNWFGRLAVGALCLVFFWLLLIPVFILLGYFVETVRTISRGGRELPAWTNVGNMLKEGFFLFVVLIIWELPEWILNSGSISCSTRPCTYQPGALGNIGNLYGLFLSFLAPAIWNQFVEGGFGSAFDFRAVFRRAGQNPGMTVTVWLMAIVAGLIGGLGVLLVFVGLLFTLPYAFAVIANLYAQFGRLTQSPAPVTHSA